MAPVPSGCDLSRVDPDIVDSKIDMTEDPAVVGARILPVCGMGR